LFGGRTIEGADWLGVAIGGLFLAMALTVALLTTRYFYRRRGSLAALAYVAGFWGLIGLGLVAAWGGRPNWPSLVAIGACVLVNAGYGVYLETRRKDLRAPPVEAEQPLPPAMRKCPTCGLTVDAKLPECPICKSGNK
jgi:MFS family permease